MFHVKHPAVPQILLGCKGLAFTPVPAGKGPLSLRFRQQDDSPGGEAQGDPALPGGEALTRQQVQGLPALPGEGQSCLGVPRVEGGGRGLALRLAAEGQQRPLGVEPGQVPPAEGGPLPEPPQQAEPGQQVFVLPAPGVAAPAEGVLQALEPGLVAVKEHGGAGKA